MEVDELRAGLPAELLDLDISEELFLCLGASPEIGGREYRKPEEDDVAVGVRRDGTGTGIFDPDIRVGEKEGVDGVADRDLGITLGVDAGDGEEAVWDAE